MTKLSIFIISLFLSLSTAFLNANAFETNAKYAILMDATTKHIIFSKNPDTQMKPSSMSKLMTLYVLFEKLNNKEISLSDKFIISEAAWRKQGSKMFLPIGSMVSVEDLIRGIIVQSGNDACIAVAEGLMGSEDIFVEALNKKAHEINLDNSIFMNATGWPDDGHLMTARDLATLSLRLIEDFSQYYPYFSETEFTYHNITQPNRNELLKLNLGVDGLKTGHTDEAGYGIAVSANKNGRRLILVVNGLKNTSERTREAVRLLQYGFLNFTNVVISQKDKPIEEAPLWMSKEKSIPLTTEQDVILTLPKDQAHKIHASVKYKSPIIAPIKKGEAVGELILKLPEHHEEKIYPLIAAADAHRLPYFSRLIRHLDYYLFGK
jgi:D-alanyl-D-alanine carboxypeptidase (penicillin-binding protein 5/6)